MTDEEKDFLAQVALGWFSVDQEGRIWRHVRFVGSRVGNPSRPEPVQIERAERSFSKYPKVMFWTLEGRKAVYAHRIVWMILNHEDIPLGMEINHKDGQKNHNHPDNLELLTHSQNILHSFQVLGQKVKDQRGSKNTSAKLTEAQVLEIRSLWDQHRTTQTEIGRRFGLSQVSVSEIVLRKTWKHLP